MTLAARRSVGLGLGLNEATVPAYFRCPISLELMSDPVTVSTGHTYDRSSIQRWFHAGKNTCPNSRQVLNTTELIPNLTLKNCIRGWQITTGFPKNDRIPTSPRLLTEQNVRRMLDDIKAGNDRIETLRNLRVMAKATDKNRTMICDGGALPVLGSILSSHDDTYDSSDHDACEEALAVVAALSASEEIKQSQALTAVGLQNLSTLAWFLLRGSLDSKLNAAVVVECLVVDDDSLLELGAVEGLMKGLVGLLKEQLYPKAVTASLRSLYAICLPRKNRAKAIEAGVVAGVVELLPGAKKEIVEGGTAILALMARCSQGREALYAHALTIPVLVKAVIAYSNSVTEHAVKVLHSMLIHGDRSAHPLLPTEAVKSGVIPQLLLVIQIQGNNPETKQRAQELLKFLQITCSADPCIKTIKYSR